MKKSWLVIILLAIALLVAWILIPADDHESSDHGDETVSLENRPGVRDSGSFDIAVSFYPLQYIVETITGDLATVYNVGEGVDPHDYRLTSQDLLNLQRSDLVILQGAEFEPWADDAIEQLRDTEVPYLLATADLDLIALSDSHEDEHHDEHEEENKAHETEEHHDEEHHDEHEDHEEEHGHDYGEYDPHTWLDPLLMIEKINSITDAISTLDYDNTTTYRQNADSLIQELEQLHTDYQTTLAQCTAGEAIVSHDAFGYLTKRYNLDMHPIAGVSTKDTPSAKLLAELGNQSKDGVIAILTETSSVTTYSETLSRDTGLEILPINTIAFAIPEGDDYLSLMESNLNSLASAYACN